MTFRFASGNDWWFQRQGHSGLPRHRPLGKQGTPRRHYETAAAVAAYYSNGRDSEKVDVDYLQKKM